MISLFLYTDGCCEVDGYCAKKCAKGFVPTDGIFPACKGKGCVCCVESGDGMLKAIMVLTAPTLLS